MSVSVTVDTTDRGTPAARAVSTELVFAEPPPGMLDLHRFTLTALDESGYLFALRSAERDEVRLFLMPPRPYFPDYAPALDTATQEALGVADGEAVLLVVVHPGQDGTPPTANLLAPIAVNPSTGAALQVVLDADWPLRAPLGATAAAS